MFSEGALDAYLRMLPKRRQVLLGGLTHNNIRSDYTEGTSALILTDYNLNTVAYDEIDLGDGTADNPRVIVSPSEFFNERLGFKARAFFEEQGKEHIDGVTTQFDIPEFRAVDLLNFLKFKNMNAYKSISLIALVTVCTKSTEHESDRAFLHLKASEAGVGPRVFACGLLRLSKVTFSILILPLMPLLTDTLYSKQKSKFVRITNSMVQGGQISTPAKNPDWGSLYGNRLEQMIRNMSDAGIVVLNLTIDDILFVSNLQSFDVYSTSFHTYKNNFALARFDPQYCRISSASPECVYFINSFFVLLIFYCLAMKDIAEFPGINALVDNQLANLYVQAKEFTQDSRDICNIATEMASVGKKTRMAFFDLENDDEIAQRIVAAASHFAKQAGDCKFQLDIPVRSTTTVLQLVEAVYNNYFKLQARPTLREKVRPPEKLIFTKKLG